MVEDAKGQTKTNPMQLSILDLCKRSSSKSARESLEETLELASLADALGYTRYWIAEHHTHDAAHASPEVLLPLLASRTNNIRLGAGGVLLRYYSPLKVAETFLAIEALFPGRFDLGVCKGTGVSADSTAHALVSGNTWELTEYAFQRKVEELQRILGDARCDVGSQDISQCATPWGVTPPPTWVLGSGSKSMKLASATGSPYSFMAFYDHDQSYGPALIREYRQSFLSTAQQSAPYSNIVVAVTCMETDARAQQRDLELLRTGFTGNIVGSPRRCAQRLLEFGELYGTGEILLATGLEACEERASMYRLLAEECAIASDTTK
jgi:luciferase family oxidoreductase group 1